MQSTVAPYSQLMQNKRNYEIMLLRDQQGLSYDAIAKKVGISKARIYYILIAVKKQQIKLYIQYLASLPGKENLNKNSLFKLYDYYGSYPYIAAYFEKEFPELLAEYRMGEPGLPEHFLAELPPLIEVTQEMTDCIVQLRNEKNRSFIEIGKALRLTPEKAAQVYQSFYQQKMTAALEIIKHRYPNAQNIRRKYIHSTASSKTNFEQIIREYPELLNEID